MAYHNELGKLGEDLARPGEILVAQTAIDQLDGGNPFSGEAVNFSIAGLGLEAIRIVSQSEASR